MIKNYIGGILGGVSISIGCIVSLSVGGGTLGAFLFSIGLLSICVFGYKLYTGAVCSLDRQNFTGILMILYGNLVGICVMALLTRLTRPELMTAAQKICESKLHEGWRVIPLGMLCNICIYFATTEFEKTVERVCLLIISVMVFILAGFEHSIANTFYFCLTDIPAIKVVPYLVMNIIGNGAGGIVMYRIVKGYRNGKDI